MRSSLSPFLPVVIALVIATIPPTPALAANPAPVQIFYVTLPEFDGLTVLRTINSDASSPITTYFSIAISASGTDVYYDQWEDGYAADIANPTAGEIYDSAANPDGVQIWGNGQAADGCVPNKVGVAVTCADVNDVLNAGDVIILNNTVPIPRIISTILYDARDKIGASKSISMVRAMWASGSNTLNAFAHEMYPTFEWGTAYEAPVGCDSASPGTDMFEYSGLSIMAAQSSTPIRVDADGDGTWDFSGTLNEGGSYLEGYRSRPDPECDYVHQGARVESTDAAKPIQVVLVTGDIGSSYESRDMNLLPVSAYGSSYWSPVGVDTTSSGPTRLWLYNLSTNGDIYITCERYGLYSPALGPIGGRQVATIDLTNGVGARCYASTDSGFPTNDKIFAVGTVDTDNNSWDWSFTLYPDDFLTTAALVGLGLGRDPTSSTNPTQDGSPLWVTAACASGGTYVYVDWDNNGTADPVDTNGDGAAEADTENGLLINRLQSVRLFQPSPRDDPYDQSGALVWSRTASGVGRGGTPGCKLALAWGADPRTASPGAPGLDVGTSVPPLRSDVPTAIRLREIRATGNLSALAWISALGVMVLVSGALVRRRLRS